MNGGERFVVNDLDELEFEDAEPCEGDECPEFEEEET